MESPINAKVQELDDCNSSVYSHSDYSDSFKEKVEKDDDKTITVPCIYIKGEDVMFELAAKRAETNYLQDGVEMMLASSKHDKFVIKFMGKPMFADESDAWFDNLVYVNCTREDLFKCDFRFTRPGAR